MGNRFASGVYAIQNAVSGAVYIGSARRFKRRFSQHRTALRGGYHQNSHLQYAWNKYGEQAFEFKVLLVCLPKHMQDYEQRCLDSLAPAYNKSRSAFSGIPVGAKLTKKHKAKVGAASKRLWGTPEYRRSVTTAIREAMTIEEKAQRSQRAERLWANPEYRAKAVSSRKGNAYYVGHVCTPEQILNRKRAARISNMKRNYGTNWRVEYVRRYPDHSGDINV